MSLWNEVDALQKHFKKDMSICASGRGFTVCTFSALTIISLLNNPFFSGHKESKVLISRQPADQRPTVYSKGLGYDDIVPCSMALQPQTAMPLPADSHQ